MLVCVHSRSRPRPNHPNNINLQSASNRRQRERRSRVASDDQHFDSVRREEARILNRVPLNRRQRLSSIRHTRRVAEIDKPFIRQMLVQRAIDGQTADAGIEIPMGGWLLPIRFPIADWFVARERLNWQLAIVNWQWSGGRRRERTRIQKVNAKESTCLDASLSREPCDLRDLRPFQLSESARRWKGLADFRLTHRHGPKRGASSLR